MKGRRTVDPETGLTANQEAFCVELAKTGNASEAYRKAYDAKNMKPATISRRAFELTENGKIKARMESLRADARKHAGITLGEHLTDLKVLRNLAVKSNQISAAVSAEVARGKASGLYDGEDTEGDAPAPTVVNVNVIDGRKSA